MSIAIWHRSEQELNKVLRESPQLINQTNGLGNTPLHLAVGWPYGIRALLQHGACINATDQNYSTPLSYAIEMGASETVRILFEADCHLGDRDYSEDVLLQAINQCTSNFPRLLSISREARTDVLGTVISSLAERRRNLQTRLAALSIAAKINPGVFQDDRILDEYAQYAECVEEDAMRGNDHMPRHASSLLPTCRTVYHVVGMTVEVAEKLWQNGFRDVDVPNEYGLTPLMYRRFGNPIDEIEVFSWLIQKGAKLHRLQHRTPDNDADPTISAIELRPASSALHYVAYNIGHAIGPAAKFIAEEEYRGRQKRPLQVTLHQLSKVARLLAATVLLDVSYDDSICA